MGTIKRNDELIRDWVIYLITSPSGRKYVGKASYFAKRMRYYKAMNCKSQQLLYKSLNKYGFDSHKIEQLESFSSNNLYASEREIFWISEFKSNICKYPEIRGMNCTDGGEGTVGRKATESQRKAQSERATLYPNKGHSKPHTQEAKIKMSISHQKIVNSQNYVCKNKGKKMSDATKGKLSIKNKGKQGHWLGKKKSREHIDKIANTQRGRNSPFKGVKMPPERFAKYIKSLEHMRKPVIQYTLSGEFVAEYVSLSESARVTGINKHTIRNIIVYSYKKSRTGFIFKYKQEPVFSVVTMQRRIFKKQELKTA